MPWWGWVLVIAGSLLAGGLIGAAAVAYYIGNGMRRGF
jgi:hypothetical protein